MCSSVRSRTVKLSSRRFLQHSAFGLRELVSSSSHAVVGFFLTSPPARAEVCETLGNRLEGQNNKYALETDSHLRVIGAPLGDVYAIGDCATVQNNVAENIVRFLRTIAWEKGRDPEKVHLTFAEWRDVAKRVKKRFPQASDHLRRLDRLFEQYDVDQSGTLDFGELSELLHQIDTKLTSLPATAQRANQQGVYLGRKLTKIAAALPGLKAHEIDYGDLDEAVYKAFKYKHLGSLAYISNAAIFDFGGLSFSGGVIAMYLWRSIYFAESVSFRTRCMLAMDWAKRALFGRGVFINSARLNLEWAIWLTLPRRSYELLNLLNHVFLFL